MTTVTTSAEHARRRRSFSDLSVNVKVLTAVATAALVALLVGINGIRSLSEASADAQRLYENNLISIKAVGDLQTTVAQTRTDLANQVLSADEASTTRFTEAVRRDLVAFETALAAYRASTTSGDDAVIEKAGATWATYSTIVREEMLPTGARHDAAGWAEIRDTKTLPLLTSISQDVETLKSAETADAAASAQEAKDRYESSRLTAIIALTVGLLLALALGWLVARRIVQSLRRVNVVCEAI
ncbi:MAG TPA: MCP four helix bundle domain-containing protein, partial [Actinoplanes sp.]|nr:MCP four helix bundle domain-containing protein [Actinoplanes sp.]